MYNYDDSLLVTHL